METDKSYTAFAGHRLIASGNLESTVRRTRECLAAGESAPILVFEDQTGAQIDFDFRGSEGEVMSRLSSHPIHARPEVHDPPRTGPGRPKLGVVCREVSLLPRHWSWLEQWPGGVSAALRRLVEDARKRAPGAEQARNARAAAGKFMWSMAGNFPNFEEASRALYSNDADRLRALIRDWPEDVRKHLERLFEEAMRLESEAGEESARA
jgi:hypothetical protein